jgi:hypothetical protein
MKQDKFVIAVLLGTAQVAKAAKSQEKIPPYWDPIWSDTWRYVKPEFKAAKEGEWKDETRNEYKGYHDASLHGALVQQSSDLQEGYGANDTPLPPYWDGHYSDTW